MRAPSLGIIECGLMLEDPKDPNDYLVTLGASREPELPAIGTFDKVTVERVRIITPRDGLGDMLLQNRNADAPFLFE